MASYGGQQQPAGLGLEVERLGHVEDHRPFRQAGRVRRGYQGGRPAQRGESYPAHPGQAGDLVGPGPGGVDQASGAELARVGVRAPAAGPAAGPGQRPEPGRAHHPAAAGPDTAQEPLVQSIHVDVHGGGLEHGPAEPLPPQHRAVTQRLVGAELPDRDRGGQPGGQHLGEASFGAVRAQREHAAWREERAGEAGRRRAVEPPARPGERAHHAVAVVLGEQRRRPAGRVVSRHRFPLEHGHPSRLGEEIADAGAGDPAAHHEEIALHGEKLSDGE